MSAGSELYRKVQSLFAPQTSVVETQVLRLALDHATGALHGQVLAGPFAGRPLHTLKPAELFDLMRRCRGDARSLELMAVWMERHYGAPPQPTEARRRAASGMSRKEAGAILGVDPAAPPAAVREAHRRLIVRLHPDAGGSDYLAAKVNQAKEVLLHS